jgi:hypothetical protein
MDHAEALKTKATEKYFLGELTPQQREAYENHYFDCHECAADVKSTALLMDNAREIFRTELAAQASRARERSQSVGWFGWMRPAYAMAAVALLVLVVGYQNLVTIPNAKRRGMEAAVQPLTSYSLVTSGSRGGNDLAFKVAPNAPFGLYVDIPANQKYSAYAADIQTESGDSRFHVRVTAEQAKETVQLLIPASVLASGRYNLVIRGVTNATDQTGAGEEIARYPFSLQYNQ